jgi:hypothetical protein
MEWAKNTVKLRGASGVALRNYTQRILQCRVLRAFGIEKALKNSEKWGGRESNPHRISPSGF